MPSAREALFCQKCRAPLQLDPSLDTLNPATFDILVGECEHRHRHRFCDATSS